LVYFLLGACLRMNDDHGFIHPRQFFVTFLGWLSDLFGMVKWPFQWLSDLQIGDQKVPLNHLVYIWWASWDSSLQRRRRSSAASRQMRGKLRKRDHESVSCRCEKGRFFFAKEKRSIFLAGFFQPVFPNPLVGCFFFKLGMTSPTQLHDTRRFFLVTLGIPRFLNHKTLIELMILRTSIWVDILVRSLGGKAPPVLPKNGWK